jgi:hypothetical protein
MSKNGQAIKLDFVFILKEYFYDDNGNLIQDLNKGITSIVYNLHFPLIVTTTFRSGATTA